MERPKTNWKYRYARAHLSLLNQSQKKLWKKNIDQFKATTIKFINSFGFKKSKKFIEIKFLADIWALPFCYGLLMNLYNNGRLYKIGEVLDAWVKTYEELENIKQIKIISAKKLLLTEIDDILDQFNIKRDKSKIIKTIDKDIIGGLMIEFQNKKYDNSIITKLNKIKKEIANG